MDEHQKTRRAQQQVESIIGFYIHLTVFVLVIVLLFVVNLTASPEVWWAHWPLFGWGIGVAAHGFAVLGHMPQRVAHWQLRKIYALRARM